MLRGGFGASPFMKYRRPAIVEGLLCGGALHARCHEVVDGWHGEGGIKPYESRPEASEAWAR